MCVCGSVRDRESEREFWCPPVYENIVCHNIEALAIEDSHLHTHTIKNRKTLIKIFLAIRNCLFLIYSHDYIRCRKVRKRWLGFSCAYRSLLIRYIAEIN